jgi:PGF-pre-PGF domain-containing protein
VNCNDPVLSRIAITPSAITLAKGDTATFTATAFDQDGCEMPDAEIEWECSDETVGEVDGTGFFAAFTAGTATVTATANGVTGTTEIEVTDESTGVVVSPSAIILDVGETWQFTATVYDLQENASDPAITWSCEDPEIGDIDADGLFTSHGEGSTSVTATVAGETATGTGTATVTVRSTSPELARIEVSPSDFCIPAGNSLTLIARGLDQYGFPMDIDVTWESSDLCVGTIDECGVFNALCDGEVRLIASADGISGSACVTVLPSLPVPACIEVEPLEATLAPGGTREFTATVFDQCENVMDWVRVAWSCSDADLGTIDQAGIFAAFAEGSADVTACAGGVEGTASVTITAAPTTDPTPDPGNNGGSTYRAYSDGGGSSGPSFSAGTCENLKSGETFTFSDISVSSIGSVSITAAGNIPKLLLTVKETGCPNQAEPPAGDAYEYVEIALSWANQNDISGATVTFTVPAKWLEEHGMLPEDVRLMRYVDGDWQILETEVIGEENGKYRFQATTPGFSTFAVAAMPENATVTTTATLEETTATATVTPTEEVTAEQTTAAPTTTPAAPLIYAPLLAPLAFLLWGRRKN